MGITGEILIIAGGGAGGGTNTGGGGGAGGFLRTSIDLNTLEYPINVIVGAGGIPYVNYGDGNNSSFGDLVAIAGGGASNGGYSVELPGRDGGSGGGAVGTWSASYTPIGGTGVAGQGHNGGKGFNSTSTSTRIGGGGGGAGSAGVDGVNGSGGGGGAGLSDDITGVVTWYAGGGGAGSNSGLYGTGGIGGGGKGANGAVTAVSGTPGTGGGGGGRGEQSVGNPGSGGSGIVVIRYPGSQLFTGGTITTVNGDTVHVFTETAAFGEYTNAANVSVYLDQPVSLVEIVQFFIDQPVALLHVIGFSIDQSCSASLQMALNQWCKDVESVSMTLNQWVKSLQTATLSLDQPAGVADLVSTSLGQPVSMPALLQLILDQPATISGQLVTLIVNQPVELSVTSGQVSFAINQPCSMADDQAIIQHIIVTVTVGGRVVEPDNISLRADEQNGFITSTIRFPDYAQYAACMVGEEVIITEIIDGGAPEITVLQVVTLTNPEEPGSADHIITATSPTIALDDELLTEDFGPGMADVLMVELCGRYGIILDWQGVTGWPFLSSERTANDETAFAVLRKLATASGAFLQSLPDGSLRLLPEYPLGVEAWPTASSFDLELNDQDHIFTIDDQADPRDGYNAFLLSGESSSSEKYRLEEETISATTKEIRCYMVPWDDKAQIVLDHTGGDWVSIDALDSASLPHFEYIENEQVEIVAGLGNTAYPVDRLMAVSYKQDSLGEINADYDGSLSTEVVGDALIEISYWTKYMRWLVTDPRAESLQLYIEEVA